MEKVIINAALTGMIAQKSDNPDVPVSVEEIILDAVLCYNAGASILHVHARNIDGEPTHEGAVFQEIYNGITEACPGVLISGTTSGRFVSSVEARGQALGEHYSNTPSLASLTLGSMNFRTSASVNAPDIIRKLATKMNELKIVPELEIFNRSMAEYACYLCEKSVLVPPLYCNIILGSLGTLSATPQNLVSVIEALPAHTTWAATGVGRSQFEMNVLAMAMGGHVRVGLEDNLWMDDARQELASNVKLVERIAKIADAIGRHVASPSEAAEIIGITRN